MQNFIGLIKYFFWCRSI